jgi:hypothetical protein
VRLLKFRGVTVRRGSVDSLADVAKSSSDDMRAGESRLRGPFASPPPPFLSRDPTRHTCTPYMRSSSIPGSPNLDLLKDQAPWFSIRTLTEEPSLGTSESASFPPAPLKAKKTVRPHGP